MKKQVFAVIDTNVIISALITKKSDSYPLKVLAHIYSGTIIPVFNSDILKEYKSVLSRDKFHLNPADIDEALDAFMTLGLNTNPTPATGEIFPDPNDRVFYEVAMSKQDALLVTGNTRHFPSKPFIVTPHEMAEMLETTAEIYHPSSPQ